MSNRRLLCHWFLLLFCCVALPFQSGALPRFFDNPSLFFGSEALHKEEKSDWVTIDDLNKRKKYERALERVDRALARYGDNPLFHLLKVKALSSLKSPQKALDYISNQVETHPEKIGLVAVRGLLLLDQGFLDSARSDFYSVYAKGFRTDNVLLILIQIEQELKEFSKAYTLVEKALKSTPDSDSLWFIKARLELNLRRVALARQSCVRAIELNGTEVSYFHLYIEILRFLKRKDDLEKAIKEARERFPTNSWLSLQLSSLLWGKGKVNDAVSVLKEVLEKNPNDYLVIFQLATIFGANGDLEESITFFKKGLKIKPDSTWAKIQLSKVYLRMGNTERVIQWLEKARRENTNDPFVYEYLAKYYNRKNDTYEAEKIILEGLKLNDKNRRLILEYANLLEKRGNTRETINAYEEALRGDPDNPFILGKLGSLYRVTRKYKRAKRVFQKAMILDKKSTWIRSNYIEVLDEMGDYRQALTEIDHLLRLMPTDYWAYGKKALIESDMGDQNQALESISKAIRIKPDSSWLNEIEGRILEKLKRYDLAVKSYQRALALSPERTYLWTKLAYVQIFTERRSALQSIQRVLNLDDFDIPTIELFLYLKGKVPETWGFAENSPEYRLYQQIIFKKFEMAEEELKELRRKSSPHATFLAFFLGYRKEGHPPEMDVSGIKLGAIVSPWHHLYLGMYYVRKGLSEKAYRFLNRGGELAPGNQWISIKLAYVCQQLGKYNRAVQLLEGFLKTKTEAEYGWARLRLALNYDQSGQYAKSEKAYRRILEKNPNSNVALNNLAWMYLTTKDPKMNKLEEAFKLATRAVEIHPSAANLDTLAEAHFQKKEYSRALKTIERALDRDRQSLDDFKRTKKKILKAMRLNKK